MPPGCIVSIRGHVFCLQLVTSTSPLSWRPSFMCLHSWFNDLLCLSMSDLHPVVLLHFPADLAVVFLSFQCQFVLRLPCWWFLKIFIFFDTGKNQKPNLICTHSKYWKGKIVQDHGQRQKFECFPLNRFKFKLCIIVNKCSFESCLETVFSLPIKYQYFSLEYQLMLILALLIFALGGDLGLIQRNRCENRISTQNSG